MIKKDIRYIYPPDFQKSQKHYLATRIFKNIKTDSQNEECQCCNRKIGQQSIKSDIHFSPQQLSFLGPGLPLFFIYLRNSIILLAFLCAIFGIYVLYSNIATQYCQKTTSKCEYTFFNIMAIVNKIGATNELTIQNYLLLAFVVFSILMFQVFRRNFRVVEYECDSFVDTPSDYSMIIRRLPPQCTKSDIQQMINIRRQQLTPQQLAATQNLRVVDIVQSYRLRNYTLTQQKNRQNFMKHIQQQNQCQFIPQPLPPPEEPSTIAIVIFARQYSKQLFLYKANFLQKLLQCIWSPCLPLSHLTVKGVKVAIERAPQPDDMIWENAGITLYGAIIRKTLYSILAIAILLISGAAQYSLAVAQNQMKSSRDKQIMGTASSLITLIFNSILQFFIVYSTEKERGETKTQLNTTLMVKISFFQFLNTGVFLLLANYLADINNFSLEEAIASQVTQIMIINSISPNITLFILNFFNLFNYIKKWMIKRGTIKCSQYDANKAFEGPLPQIQYKYAFILKTLWLTAFYAPFVPIVIPISIVALLINYYLEKLLYSWRYRAPNMISSMINDSAVQLLEYFTLILSMAQLLVYLYFVSFKPTQIPSYWAIPIYLSIVLSGVNLILPMEQLNKKLFKITKDNALLQPYQKVQHKFEVTYQITNPAITSNSNRKRDKFLFNMLFTSQKRIIEMVEPSFNPNHSIQPTNRNAMQLGNKNQLDGTNFNHQIAKNIEHEVRQVQGVNFNSTKGYRPDRDKKMDNTKRESNATSLMNNSFGEMSMKYPMNQSLLDQLALGNNNQNYKY